MSVITKSGLFSACVFVHTAAFSQKIEPTISFYPSFKAGETVVYQLAEKRFQQNPQGHFISLQEDTSYYVFKVTEVKDSFTLVDFNYAESYADNQIVKNEFTTHNPLKTETYKLLLDSKGNLIELTNWERFRTILTFNLIQSYKAHEIDSMTLKYYYLYYENQQNVEDAVIKPVSDFLYILGKEYVPNQDYTIAKEIVNPFGGENLQKSCKLNVTQLENLKNSVFISGMLVTDYDDNIAMQEDYYLFRNSEREPSEESPYIYIRDDFEYQYNTAQKRIMSYKTTHNVYLNNNKQGLEKSWNLFDVSAPKKN
ncbi:MAG: hypothetical protein H7321_01810 [Bacteroidia bacterium]|nr:hypothetical protein [Bacteroidia bacterium]